VGLASLDAGDAHVFRLSKEDLMNTLRKNFTLLSLLCYVVEWVVVIAALVLVFPGKSGFALLDAMIHTI